MRLLLALFLAATAGAAVGCDSGGAEWHGRIEERDGVVHVTNPEAGLWAHAETPPFRFELEQTFGSDGEPRAAMLGQPFQIHFDVDADGNVYVLDGQSSRLVAFSSRGTVLWEAGREGEGPGEFNSPRGLAVNPRGLIVVGNDGSTQLSTWSTDGSFLRTYSLVEEPVDLTTSRILGISGFVGVDTLVLDGPMWGRLGERVYRIGMDPFELLGSFEWDQEPELQAPRGVSNGPPVRAGAGRIFLGSSAGYRFRTYDADGTLRREVTRPVDYPPRSGFYEVDGSRGISGFGQLSPPLALPDGYLLVALWWTTGIDDPDAAALASYNAFREGRRPEPRDRRTSLDLFDGDGRFLYAIEGEGMDHEIGDPTLIGADGKLYTLAEDPFPQIRRYRIHIEPPGSIP